MQLYMKLLKKAYGFMSVYKNIFEEDNMIFKHMSLEEAKEFYQRLKEQGEATGPSPVLKIAMDDIWFFTDGLTKPYGRVN